MTVTLRDVARAAGVHPGTASKALNEATRDRVAAGTVQRVLAAAQPRQAVSRARRAR